MNNDTQFTFYRNFYNIGYLGEPRVHEAAKWGVITKEQYKQITGQTYTN